MVLASCRLRYALTVFFALSPYEVPKLGVLQAQSGFHRSRRDRSEQGGTPPRYRPSYRAPPVNSRVSRASNRSQPPVASRRPQHRPAPHVSQGFRPAPRPGLAPGFPHTALGVRPEDPFRVALLPCLIPHFRGDWSGVERAAMPPQRPVECRASEDLPQHAASPAFALGMAVPRLLVRPRRHPGEYSPRIATPP